MNANAVCDGRTTQHEDKSCSDKILRKPSRMFVQCTETSKERTHAKEHDADVEQRQSDCDERLMHSSRANRRHHKCEQAPRSHVINRCTSQSDSADFGLEQV